MEHMRKLVVLFCFVLLFQKHLALQDNSERHGNSLNTDTTRTMVLTSSAVIRTSVVNRKGGGSGGGGGGGGGGGRGGGGGGRGFSSGRSRVGTGVVAGAVGGAAVGAAVGATYGNTASANNHPSSNGTLNSVCLYSYLLLFISTVAGISLNWVALY